MEKTEVFFPPPPFLSITWRNIGKHCFFQLKTAPLKGRGKGQRKKKRDIEEMEQKGVIS